MDTYKSYFDQVSYKPKYEIGDRVFGYYHKIPFIGSVCNDSLVSIGEGPRVSIFLDLPMKTKDGLVKFIKVKHKDVKSKLVKY